ncbi:MAG TPA: YraN family protein [Firmicutes bacterium]|nr:YraN family protein [Bacillota bacterium]
MSDLNKFKGSSGERIAEEYLKKEGYDILARNFRTRLGEIDIVASKGEYLVFVEVKARKSEAYGFPSESVTYAKQRKISMVASQYIKLNMYFGAAVRFDVIEVYLTEGRINHIENAFDSYLKY